ncbi:hypothetical protein PQX77_021663 [Marasmius sp. AFHP31]|nr:hypothetical protein PQX77_021663 [Marasmius sp. AFHP31]
MKVQRIQCQTHYTPKLTVGGKLEMANGWEFVAQYPNDGIVCQYLDYTRELAIQALCIDQTRTFWVSGWFEDWLFNPKTSSWHYDVVAASINGWRRDKFSFSPIPLPQGTQPQLNAQDIGMYFEKTFSDVLYLYASMGLTSKGDLSDFASHGLLTFGAVVEHGGGIVAYFPSTPSPYWHIEVCGQLIAKFSTKGVPKLHPSIPLLIETVPSRVDLQFLNAHQPQLSLHFLLRLPLKERTQLRAAYLSQHLSGARSHWWPGDYDTVRQHLIKKNYGLDGRRYTQDKGYPELMLGDPHERKIEELYLLDEDEPLCLASHLKSSSLFSLADTPINPKDKIQEPSVTACLARQLSLWTNINADTASQPKGESRVMSLERKTDQPDGWVLV